jgi:photosystem II stability/assembly factor-like uncharacterized protein
MQIDLRAYAVNPHEVDDIFFLDQRHGWVVLEDHKRNLRALFRTNDGGKTWPELNAPRGIGQTYFVDSQVGWALRGVKSRGRYYSYLLRSRDGGTTWQQTTTEPLEAKLAPDEFVVRMAFSDHKAGWFFTSRTGPSGSVLVTRDGGKSVEVSSTPKNNQDYRGIFVLPSGRAWILGSENILATRNFGKTWEQQFDWVDPRLNPVETLLASAWFFPDGRGWVVGQEVDEGIVLATGDFGNHWQRAFESREPPGLKSVYFSDENDGCAVGLFESLLCTRDGGSTWTNRKVLPAPKGTQANFFIQIVMLKSGRGFAMRAGGFLYETKDGGQTWHEFDPLSAAPKKKK